MAYKKTRVKVQGGGVAVNRKRTRKDGTTVIKAKLKKNGTKQKSRVVTKSTSTKSTRDASPNRTVSITTKKVSGKTKTKGKGSVSKTKGRNLKETTVKGYRHTIHTSTGKSTTKTRGKKGRSKSTSTSRKSVYKNGRLFSSTKK